MTVSLFLHKIYNRWKQMHWSGYIGIAVLLSVLFTIPVVAFMEFAGISDEEIGSPGLIDDAFAVQIVVGIIIAPMLETWLCQQVPVQIIQRLTNRSNYGWCLFTSSVFFAAMHVGYSIWYSIIVFPMGLVLAETYLVFQQRKESAYWATFTVHALRNLLAFLANNLS